MDITKALEKVKELAGDEVFKLVSAEVAKVATLTTENEEFKTSNTKLGEDIKERDGTISTLKQNAKEQGLNFKKLRDMTKEESDLLSEKDKEILQRQEKLEEDQAEWQKGQAERDKKQKDQTIEALATKMAKGDKELISQIKINLGKLNPELLTKAITEADLTPLVDNAFKMTGAGIGPDALRSAHNHGGETAPVETKDGFGATKEGKSLAGAMGLSQATPEGEKAIATATTGTAQ